MARARARPVYPYEVTVEGGVVTPSKMGEDEDGELKPLFEHGLLSLNVTGVVCVLAHNKKEAGKLAVDLLYGEGERGPVLSLEDGEAVDFVVKAVRRLEE